jgi:hypothetical protein
MRHMKKIYERPTPLIERPGVNCSDLRSLKHATPRKGRAHMAGESGHQSTVLFNLLATYSKPISLDPCNQKPQIWPTKMINLQFTKLLEMVNVSIAAASAYHP